MKELAEMIRPIRKQELPEGYSIPVFYTLEKGILIKVFGEQPEEMPYQKFVEQVKRIFDGSAAGNHTWENYFAESRKMYHSRKNQRNQNRSPARTVFLDDPEDVKAQIAPAKRQRNRNTRNSRRRLTGRPKGSFRNRKTRKRWNIFQATKDKGYTRSVLQEAIASGGIRNKNF